MILIQAQRRGPRQRWWKWPDRALSNSRHNYAGGMSGVMAVTFTPYGRLYHADPGPYPVKVGDQVLIPTNEGAEVATVVWGPEEVNPAPEGLPICEGMASPQDLERAAANVQRRAEITAIARSLIAAHRLAMKVVGVDLVDRSAEYGQLVAVYYTAPHRVDFRELLSDLAHTLRSRIDLRQIGSRDAARIQGGVGSCGRDLCCASFMTVFEPITMRMVRDQDFTGNPLQIQGACGRLKCCLAYEHPLYEDFRLRAPGLGEQVDTPQGPAVVVSRSALTESVTLRGRGGEPVTCPLREICAHRFHDPSHRRGNGG